MKQDNKTPNNAAPRRAEMPEESRQEHSVINARSLQADHKRLGEVLRPGMSVLDVGCGGGAITRGIAEAVGVTGRVVGMDINTGLIEDARRRHGGVPGLSFEFGDIQGQAGAGAFDVVTAARVLQWLADPTAALRHMIAAAKQGGLILVLDYNHEKIAWTPEPPASMRAFYAAFLRWRAEAGMDNAIANHLGSMFAQAGLTNVVITPQHETTRRGDPDFEARIGIWAEVAATRGRQIVSDGILSEIARANAEVDYRHWMDSEAQAQTLYLLAVEGIR